MKFSFTLDFLFDLNKEASFGRMESIRIPDQLKPLITRLCIMVLSDKVYSSLAVFLNGCEHIEVLLNPCKINQDQKVWNTISRLHPSHN